MVFPVWHCKYNHNHMPEEQVSLGKLLNDPSLNAFCDSAFRSSELLSGVLGRLDLALRLRLRLCLLVDA